MQGHDGKDICNANSTGDDDRPCSDGAILQMARDGTAGTYEGDGLVQGCGRVNRLLA